VSEPKKPDNSAPQTRLIAAMLVEHHLLADARIALLPEDAFGSDGALVKLMRDIFAQGGNPTPAAITSEMRTRGNVRGVSGTRLEFLAANPPWEHSHDDLIALVIRDYERDEIGRRLRRLAEVHALDGDTEATQQLTSELIVSFEKITAKGETTQELVQRALEYLMLAPEGVAHGLPAMSSDSPLFENGWLINLGGTTKSGKSTLVQQIVLFVLANAKRVAYFPLELKDKASAAKLIGQKAGVAINQRGDKMSGYARRELAKAAGELANAPLHVSHNANIFNIIARCQEIRPDFVVIDQLSHLTGLKLGDFDGKRTYVYEEYMRLIRTQIVLKLNIPVITVFQLKKGEHRPTYADAKDSGSIGEYCDQMIFVYRPDRQKPDATIILELNRHGPPADYEVTFNGAKGMFVAKGGDAPKYGAQAPSVLEVLDIEPAPFDADPSEDQFTTIPMDDPLKFD
jgi:replicative DNA helicase